MVSFVFNLIGFADIPINFKIKIKLRRNIILINTPIIINNVKSLYANKNIVGFKTIPKIISAKPTLSNKNVGKTKINKAKIKKHNFNKNGKTKIRKWFKLFKIRRKRKKENRKRSKKGKFSVSKITLIITN